LNSRRLVAVPECHSDSSCASKLLSKTSVFLVFASLIGALGPGNIAAQFVPTDPLNDHDYVDLLESVYAQMAPDFNNDFSLPERVYLTSASCGVANAFYDPEGNQIVFCSELIDLMVEGAFAKSDDESSQAIGVTAQIFFTLFHELGHALIDVLDLPVLGQEEDAADQLAAVLMTDEPVLAMWAADFWRSVSGFGSGQYADAETFADSHGLNEQRFYNLMCWAFGADPLVRSYVVTVSELPLERVQGCENEYDQMSAAWERLLSPYLRNPSTFSDLDPKRNTSGAWSFMESVQDEAGEVRCTGSGTLGLWQTGETLSGNMITTGRCIFYGAPVDSSGETGFEGGIVSGNVIGFEVDACRYSGVIEEPDLLRLDGTITCQMEVGDTVLTLTGRWSAVR
jgi:hypothetical protein